MSQRGSLQRQSVLNKIVLIAALICLVVGMASAVTAASGDRTGTVHQRVKQPDRLSGRKRWQRAIFRRRAGRHDPHHQNWKLLPKPFLNITSLVESGGEEGLLGLAFHPAYKTNGRFFVNYTRIVRARFKP